MRPITLTDLDGVHFQPRRKCPPNATLTQTSQSIGGHGGSFSTPQQMAFINWMFSGSLVIPVTARDVADYRRVTLPFKDVVICSFGGMILLPDGTPQPDWFAHISACAAASKEALGQMRASIESDARSLGIEIHSVFLGEPEFDLYVNCKHKTGDEQALSSLADVVGMTLPEGWSLHNNGNNLAVLPPFLGKEKAVAYYLAEMAPPHSCVIGMGDSFSDLKFMGLCDFAVAPTDSQVFEMLRR